MKTLALGFMLLALIGPAWPAAPYSVTVLAGSAGSSGTADGEGEAAQFKLLGSIALDRAGNLIAADTLANTVRRITPDGSVSTLAGSPGIRQAADGPRSDASLLWPYAVAVDRADNIYVACYDDTIRKISPDGNVSTLAGRSQAPGPYDGPDGDARFGFSWNFPTDNGPLGIALDKEGNLYAADPGNRALRKITPDGVVTTVAGGFGTKDLVVPWTVAVASNGDVLVGDFGARKILRVAPDGTVSTLVDFGQPARPVNYPTALTTAANGDIYYCAYASVPAGVPAFQITPQGLWKLTPEGEPTLLEGPFPAIEGLVVAANGTIYLTEYAGTRVFRAIPPPTAARTESASP